MPNKLERLGKTKIEVASDLTPEAKAQVEQLLTNCFKSNYTIDDAIQEAEQIKCIRDNSFEVCLKNQKAISDHLWGDIVWIYYLKISAIYYKFVARLRGTGREEIAQEFYDILDDCQHNLKTLKKLIGILGKTLKMLRKNQAMVCNVQISDLLHYIFEKERLIIQRINYCSEISQVATSGITAIGTQKNQEALDEVNADIVESCKALGLYKETPSDK